MTELAKRIAVELNLSQEKTNELMELVGYYDTMGTVDDDIYHRYDNAVRRAYNQFCKDLREGTAFYTIPT